ncbi:porin [Paraburkholderia tropica]|uniref:porin n=1 Tax=Paraburkholderia tropica TaxID=92647 RepID=UPI002AAF4CAF|nr:porin [Paraburkholderia tropica]
MSDLFKRAAAIAVAMTATQAYAQSSGNGSSVTLFGLLDGGVSYVSNEGGHQNIKFDNGVLVPSLWGLLGNEDLGGGLKAMFKLVSQFNLGTGALASTNTIFGREAWVGLESQQFGSLSFGNQYDFMFDSITGSHNSPAVAAGGLYAFAAGPFSKLALPGLPQGQLCWDRTAGGFELTNTVKYVTPSVGGFKFGALYGFGGVAGAFGADSSMSFGANYDQGPFGIGLAYVSYKSSSQENFPVRNWGVGAHYDFEKLTLSADITGVRNTFNGGAIVQGSVGASYYMAPDWVLGGEYTYMKGNAYLDNNHAHQISTTLSHLLSKRTTVYVQAIYQRTNSGAPGSSNGGALINGVVDTSSQSTSPSQFLGRIGVSTMF